MATLHDAIEYVLENEGGFSNHPHDRGGATKFGISSVILSAFLQRAATIDDVQELDEDRAYEIYEKYFWEPLKLKEVPNQFVATAIFDVAVNMGVPQAVKLTQSALNDLMDPSHRISVVAVDGIMGPETLQQINAANPEVFIKIFRVKLLSKYSDIVARIPEQRVFLSGWKRRADRLLTLV